MIKCQQNAVTTSASRALTREDIMHVSKARLAGLKIMVIDDSITIRHVAEMLLLQAGCEVILAEDGFDALEKISTHCPDIIFTDVLMPRLDGYKTCALIKRSTSYRHIPVIMLTSKDSLFDRARGHTVGSSQLLNKPFTKETLLTIVEAICQPGSPIKSRCITEKNYNSPAHLSTRCNACNAGNYQAALFAPACGLAGTNLSGARVAINGQPQDPVSNEHQREC